MKRTNTILGIATAAAMMLAVAPSALRAESAAPTGQASDYFAGNTAAYYDPQAGGTKYSGTLTVAYDKSAAAGSCTSFVINKMYVVLTLQQGNTRMPFTTTSPSSICFDNQEAQVNVILDLIRSKTIPAFYNGCVPGSCPNFKVKSFTNFQYTSGANSADITIAVQ